MSLTITLPTGAELEALLEQLSGTRCVVAPTDATGRVHLACGSRGAWLYGLWLGH